MAKSNTKSKSHLSSLSQIVREIDSAADLDSALQVLVHRTRELMGADVCSAYFTDEARRRHVAAATDGLSSRIVGNVQFEFGKGLIGQVAETRQPVNLDRVPLELEQSFLLQTGAELYQGFLGVPIIHKAQVQGVLLVRQRQARRFDDEDEAFLTTLATQLGSAIAYAKANGEWCHMCRPGESLPQLINGLAGAPGLAIGQGVAVFDSEDIDDIPDRSVEDTRAEEIRLRAAIQSVRTEIAGLSNKLKGALAEADRALFDAYLLMLDSPEILETAVSLVREGSWAPGAVRQIIE
ncbi:MAG: GAF domain-containing protein, partial [Gammaproteobacteria bacterium]|nr:GAF domain-containing protein [Gammaproteobacteria bacterium]